MVMGGNKKKITVDRIDGTYKVTIESAYNRYNEDIVLSMLGGLELVENIVEKMNDIEVCSMRDYCDYVLKKRLMKRVRE